MNKMMKPISHLKQTVNFSLIAAVGYFLLQSSAHSIELIPNSFSTNTQKIRMAQNDSSCPLIDNRPNPPIQSALLYLAETKNYQLRICSDYSGKPAFYVGSAKNGSGDITLPLQSYRNNQFIAVNGDTRYTLNRNLLLVTRGRKTITRERIIRWQRIQEDA